MNNNLAEGIAAALVIFSLTIGIGGCVMMNQYGQAKLIEAQATTPSPSLK